MKLNIRARLTLQFYIYCYVYSYSFSLSFIISLPVTVSPNFIHLENKAINTAKLLIEVKEVDYNLLKIIDRNTINAIYNEKVMIYDYKDL